MLNRKLVVAFTALQKLRGNPAGFIGFCVAFTGWVHFLTQHHRATTTTNASPRRHTPHRPHAQRHRCA